MSAWRAVWIVGFGTLVVPFDSSVNVAFPYITAAFGLDVPQIQWVVIFYTLAFASLMLVFGRLGDIFGHRRVFVLGAAASAIAFAGCGAASSYPWLLAARALQGVGAALLVSCGPALVTQAAAETMRARMLGLYTMIFGVGGALGPILAGPLIAQWGWSAVYWFRVPVAGIACLAALALPAAHGTPMRAQRRETFDTPGAVLLVLAIAMLVLTLDRLRHLPLGVPILAAAAAAAVATTAAFIWREVKTARPIIELRVFRVPVFALANAGNLLVNLSMFSVLLLLPFYLARTAVMSPPMAGLLLSAQPLGAMIAAPLAGRASGRTAPERLMVWSGLLAAAALAPIGFVGREPAIPPLAAAMFANGVGVGVFQVAYFDLVTATLPRGDRGVAGSLAMATRTIGLVAGATLLMLAFQGLEAAALRNGADATQAFVSGIRGAFRIAAAIPLLPALLVAAISRSRRAPGC
jgi:MFS family permease